ncbi:MAG: DUF2267 domain-containing protein [Sandaracinaceae bacterium]|nr:DUF2267 domain-containing protein [Sandaracinaceae bacterium]
MSESTTPTEVSTGDIAQRVEERVELPRGVHGAEAIVAVMCPLLERVTRGAARGVLASMPDALRQRLRACAHPREQPELLFGRAELLHRVGHELGVDDDRAERIVRGVLEATLALLTFDQARHVGSQLPRDLQVLWGAAARSTPHPPKSEAALAHPAREVPRAYADALERTGALPSETTPTRAVAAVLCTLAMRLSRGEARALAGWLPPELRGFIRPCATHGGHDEPEVFDREELVRRVAGQLGATEEQAERITRAVFAKVRGGLPEHEARNVASQLPKDIQALWLAP